jgi:hypothetical protein
MRWAMRAGLSLAGACAFVPVAVRAQSDYRNLDPGRPIAVEDAQPVEYRALESQWGLPHFVRQRSGSWLVAAEPEFKLGLLKNLQAGFSSEYVVARDADETVVAARDRQFHLLYNFNQETRRLPAIAVRPELAIHSGGLGSGEPHGSLKLIVSKTAGHNRVHLNGSYTVGPTALAGRGGELVNRFFYGAAYERTLPLKFLVILADVYARKPIDSSPAEVVFETGMRVQLTPRWVLDAGVNTGKLRPSAGHEFGFTFGLSRSFSFRFLQPHKGSS